MDAILLKAGSLMLIIAIGYGIKRLGWGDRISSFIPTEQMVSAVGQGAIGIEIREDDSFMSEVCARLSDPDTLTCVTAERVVMNRLDGGCQVPIGAYARIEGDQMVIDAMVGSVDGTTILRAHEVGSVDDPVALGMRAVAALRDAGAVEILEAIREANGAAELL